MSYKLLSITILSIGLAAYLFWPEPKPLPPTAGSAIVVFGDSLAAGVGASAGGDIASLLSSALTQPVLNLGVSGNTTADALTRIDKLLATDPRVVIVLLGGNDAIRKVPIENTFENLAQIIEHLQEAGAAVILVGEPGGLYGTAYEKEYERLASKYRTFYVSNILSGLILQPEYMSDTIHPNDEGYRIATNRILPVVQKALNTQ